MKRSVATMAVLAIVTLGAGDLLADQPVMWTDSGSGTGYVGSCGGFEVWESYTYDAAFKAHFDRDGNWLSTHVRWKVEGGVFNASAQDNFLPYKNSSYTVFNKPEGSQIAGLWSLVTVPGEGAIFMDVGLIRFDSSFNVIFEAGKHQWWSANVDALCEYLAD